MTDADIKRMLAKPGLYLVDVIQRPEEGSVMIVSQGGKLYALTVAQELRPDRFSPGAFIKRYVPLKSIGTFGGNSPLDGA